MWVPSMITAKTDHATTGCPSARATRLWSRRASASRPSRGSVRSARRIGAPATISGAATNTISRCWTMWTDSSRSATASKGGSTATISTPIPPARKARRLARIDDPPRPARRPHLANPAAQPEGEDPRPDQDQVEAEVEADDDVDDPQRDAHGGEAEVGHGVRLPGFALHGAAAHRDHDRQDREHQRPGREQDRRQRLRRPHPQHRRGDPDQQRVDGERDGRGGAHASAPSLRLAAGGGYPTPSP